MKNFFKSQKEGLGISQEHTDARLAGPGEQVSHLLDKNQPVTREMLVEADTVYEGILRSAISSVMGGDIDIDINIKFRNLSASFGGRLSMDKYPLEVVMMKVNAMRKASGIAVTLIDDLGNSKELMKKYNQINALVKQRRAL